MMRLHLLAPSWIGGVTHPMMFLISSGFDSRSVFWWRWRTWSGATLARVRGAVSMWAENYVWTSGMRAGPYRHREGPREGRVKGATSRRCARYRSRFPTSQALARSLRRSSRPVRVSKGSHHRGHFLAWAWSCSWT